MKRATLTTYPTTSAQPADLTDRLLASQAGDPGPARPRRARKPATGRPAERQTANMAPAPEERRAAPAAGLESALAAVDAATAALRQAGQEAPARYEVALRFRLDALAHHVQQIREFVVSVTAH